MNTDEQVFRDRCLAIRDSVFITGNELVPYRPLKLMADAALSEFVMGASAYRAIEHARREIRRYKEERA